MAKQDDGLFLLEVLIDKITFTQSPCFSDRDFRTCVTVECPSVQPLEICDDDPGSCTSKSGGPYVKNFNSGKSCLFSLQEADISKAMSSFPVKISVYKSLPCGCLPTKIMLGEAIIDMTKEFVQSRRKFLEDPTSVSYQALKDTFHINGPSGIEAGEIVMFLRISCFGKLIVTRFQGASGPPNLGAGQGPSFVDRSCNPRKDYQSPDDPCACGAGQAAGALRGSETVPCSAPCRLHPGGAIPGGQYGVCPTARDPYNSMPCRDLEDPCYCTGPKPPPRQQMVCRNTDPYCLHIPKGPSKQFEEIGSNLGGNELKIKVPASASIIKKISQTHCAIQSPYAKNKTEDGPCKPPCGKNQISLSLPTEAICCRGPRPQETQFTCTTEGCVQTSRHGQQAVFARGDNFQPDLPNRDVFVLKVAKTAMQAEKKCKLELELVTPKGPDKPPPVRKVNMKLATDPECECCSRRKTFREDIEPKGKKRHCCPPGNKVVFQMPSDSCGMNHKQRAHFNFTSDGVGDVSREEPGQLMPSTAKEYPGVMYDFSKQVIKLRIGKVIETLGRKSKLDYQFITPAVTHEKVVPVVDTRTAQCVPSCHCCPTKSSKRAPSRLPIFQDLTEDQIKEIKSNMELNTYTEDISIIKKGTRITYSDTVNEVDEDLEALSYTSFFSAESVGLSFYDNSGTSLRNVRSKRRSVSFSDKVRWVSKIDGQSSNEPKKCYTEIPKSTFGKKETTVYMTLFDDFCRRRTSGTQATASVNKCSQAYPQNAVYNYSPSSSGCSNFCLSCNYLTQSPDKIFQDYSLRNSEIYYLGSKKYTGMGLKKPIAVAQVQNDPVRSNVAGVQAASAKSTTGAQTKKMSNLSGRNVLIKENKTCPATVPGVKGEMIATVSHIRIGPTTQCPVHGKEPCQGPKCMVAQSGAEESAPVKVTTVNNPRRGVFELVVRKMTGAPLAKNELMLEWTPPPPTCRPYPCGSPCPTPCCPYPPVWPTKCKTVACRAATPCRPLRCYKKSCRRSCGQPCRPVPCKKCNRPTYCGILCRKCRLLYPRSRLCPPTCSPPYCRPPRSCSTCPPISCRPSRPCPTLYCQTSPCSPCSRCLPPCRPCPPSRYRPCTPLRCRPCPPLRCRPCPPPRCRPCPPPRCRPCPLPRCRPCPPLRCRPCPRPRRPCAVPCSVSPCQKLPCKPAPCDPCCASPCLSPCGSPCKSTPCLRPCPVGYRRPRKFRSHPRIKPHRKLKSPCRNRAKTCPVVRCRSVPGPCIGCCSVPPCPPLRKCCSVFPCTTRRCCPTSSCPPPKTYPIYICTPRKYLFDPLPCKANCCKSSCTTNCF